MKTRTVLSSSECALRMSFISCKNIYCIISPVLFLAKLVFILFHLLSSRSEMSLGAAFHVCRRMLEVVPLLLWQHDEGYLFGISCP